MMKKKMNKTTKRHAAASGEQGQSVLEFTLTMMVLMAVILFFVQVTLIFGFGNYAQYATFMASRAYLSAGPTKEDQVNRAEDVIRMTLKRSLFDNRDRFPMVASTKGVQSSGNVNGLTIEDERHDPVLSWRQGLRYTFKSRLFLMPLGRGGTGGREVNQLELTSESFLLREVSADECRQAMGQRNWIVDNGC